MALNTTQLLDLLVKKYLAGKASTSPDKASFEEAFTSVPRTFSQNIWFDDDLIPQTNPLEFSAHGTQHVVSGQVILEKRDKLPMQAIPGTMSFFHPDLKDLIEEGFGDGSYYYEVFTAGGDYIPSGAFDYTVDADAGILQFHTDIPVGVSEAVPPLFTGTVYKGRKGIVQGSMNVDSKVQLVTTNVYNMQSDDINILVQIPADEMLIQNASVSNPIPSNNVLDIKTLGNIVYAATDVGLWVYDSVALTSTIYDTTHPSFPLNNNIVQAVSVAADGTIAAGTQAGVWLYNGGSVTIYDATHPTQPLPDNNVTALHLSVNSVTGGYDLYVGTAAAGLTYINTSNTTIVTADIANPLPGVTNGVFLPNNAVNGITSFTVNGIKHLVVATSGGVCWAIDAVATNYTTAQSENPLPHDNTTSVAFGDNVLYVGTQLGLWAYRLREAKSEIFNTTHPGTALPNNFVKDVNFKDGTLYLATAGGFSIMQLDKDILNIDSTHNSVNLPYTEASCVAMGNGLWVGFPTVAGGVYRWGGPQQVNIYLLDTPQEGQSITIKDRSGLAYYEPIIIHPAAGHTIEREATAQIDSNDGSLKFLFSSAEWSATAQVI